MSCLLRHSEPRPQQRGGQLGPSQPETKAVHGTEAGTGTYILGLQGDQGTVGMGDKWGESHGSEAVCVGVREGSEKQLGVSLTLLTSIDNSCGGMDIGSSSKGNIRAMGGLGSVVLGSGDGHVGIKWSHSTVWIRHQAVSSKDLRLC